MKSEEAAEWVWEKARPHIIRQLEAAYEDGYRAGRKAMLDQIMRFTAEKKDEKREAPGAISQTPPPVSRGRAPRGLVGKLVDQVLSEQGGLQIVDIEDRVLGRDNRIARKSIGNELRRFKGDKYRQDDKKRWFLIRQDAEKETAGSPESTPAVPEASNQGRG